VVRTSSTRTTGPQSGPRTSNRSAASSLAWRSRPRCRPDRGLARRPARTGFPGNPLPSSTAIDDAGSKPRNRFPKDDGGTGKSGPCNGRAERRLASSRARGAARAVLRSNLKAFSADLAMPSCRNADTTQSTPSGGRPVPAGALAREPRHRRQGRPCPSSTASRGSRQTGQIGGSSDPIPGRCQVTPVMLARRRLRRGQRGKGSRPIGAISRRRGRSLHRPQNLRLEHRHPP